MLKPDSTKTEMKRLRGLSEVWSRGESLPALNFCLAKVKLATVLLSKVRTLQVMLLLEEREDEGL